MMTLEIQASSVDMALILVYNKLRAEFPVFRYRIQLRSVDMQSNNTNQFTYILDCFKIN